MVRAKIVQLMADQNESKIHPDETASAAIKSDPEPLPTNGNAKKTHGRKSLASIDPKTLTTNGKSSSRKSLPAVKVEDESSVDSDDDSADAVSKLELQYAKLQPSVELSCPRPPTTIMCEECGFGNGILIECQGVCQRAFHLECLGFTDELELTQATTAKGTQTFEFKCDECRSGQHVCFACKLSYADEPNQITRKCAVASCGKFYHDKCASESELFRKDASYAVNKPSYICPLHSCTSCWADSKMNRNSGLDQMACTRGRFIKCVSCPTAYHQSEFCLPAGSKLFSSTQLLCPLHFKDISFPKFPNHNRINVTWCFVCCESGELIGCSRCPAAYHSDCLVSNDARYMKYSKGGEQTDTGQDSQNDILGSIDKSSWLCEDCLVNKRPLYGEIVWAKVGQYRWWPAQICLPRCLENPSVRSIQCLVGEFVVKFFGTFDYYSINIGRCFTFADGDAGTASRGSLTNTSGGNSLMRAFHKACHQAKIAYQEVYRLRQARVAKTGANKYNFQMIKTNRPFGKVNIPKIQLDDLHRCDCSPNEVAPCGSDACMNRVLKYECHPLVCPAGTRCMNQRFTKREYPKQEPVKAGDRGWGLRTLVDIKKGDFVNEYVGEIIDEEECKRRMEYAHVNKITNFYFLTLDKDRVIDAGPKGNLARFANHSCEPNMETQKWVVNGDIRVGLFACKDIPAGSELTFNYQLECLSDKKAVCKCGSQNCAGFIGDRPKPIANGLSNGSHGNRKRKISENVENASTGESSLKKSKGSFASMSRLKALK